MLCASWRGREEEEKKRQKREESRQRKLERELRKHEERENKNTEHETQVNITEYDSTGHVQYQEHQLDSDGGVGEPVHGQARDSSSVLFASYPHSAQPPVHYAQFRNMDRSSIYV